MFSFGGHLGCFDCLQDRVGKSIASTQTSVCKQEVAVLWAESRNRRSGSHNEPALFRAQGRGEPGHSPVGCQKCLQSDQTQGNAVG
eukprot:12962034-Ditylum_brightwellii.AAC.1